MELGATKIEAGAVTFALQYRALMPDQGVSLQVAGEVEGQCKELLRFDCFDQRPHYHYDPDDKNERYDMDKTTAGNPISWTMKQLRTRLPDMLERAGFGEVAHKLDCGMVLQKLDQVEEAARYMALKQRRTVTHNRGDVVIEAGNVKFGLEFRELRNDRGMAIHVHRCRLQPRVGGRAAGMAGVATQKARPPTPMASTSSPPTTRSIRRR